MKRHPTLLVTGLFLLSGALASAQPSPSASPTAPSSPRTRVEAAIRHQEAQLADLRHRQLAGPVDLKSRIRLFENALHSSRALLLSILSGDRLNYEAALRLPDAKLIQKLNEERRREALVAQGGPAVSSVAAEPEGCRESGRGTQPLGSEVLAVAADASRVRSAMECPADSTNLVQSIEATHRAGQNPSYRGATLLFGSPLVRVELSAGGSIVEVRTPELQDQVSNYSSSAALTMRLASLNSTGTPSAFPRPITVPLSQEDRSNCVIQALIRNGRIIPREPTSEELRDAAILAQVTGRTAPASTAPEVNASDAFKDPKVKFAPMFGMKRSGRKKRFVGTWGLGPCVGVSLWDPTTKTAVVTHLDPIQPVGEALNALLARLRAQGHPGIQARIIGGWTGFSERTLYHARNFMQSHGIQIVQEDTLGAEREPVARGFIINADTGEVHARVRRD